MANKAINRAYLKDALKTYNERIDDAVVGALTTDIIGEDNAETGAKKGIQTLTVVDNSDTTVAAADREKLLTIVPAINELDREIGDADLTVVDNSDPAIAAADRPVLPIITDAINELDRKQGDADLTVIDTTADPAETVAKDNISDAINVLDKEMGDMATSTVVDTLAADYDPAAPVTKKVAIEAINVLDAEMGELIDNKVTDTVNAKTEPEKTVVDSLNVLDTDLGDVNTLTVKLEDGTLTKEAVAAINRLDEVQGDDVLTVIDTKEGETEATKLITTAINILDKELGENKDLIPEIHKIDTIVNAINSAFRQSVLSIEEVPVDPTDPDYSKVEHRYVFKQNYPAGTDPEVPTNILQTIDIEKPKFVKEVTTFRYEGDPVIIDPQTGEELVLHHLYMKLVIENQEDPIYLDIDHLITDFIVEDSEHIDLTLETREESGERIRVVSADIVPNSLEYTEFTAPVNRELKFTGFDHDKEVGSPEHYELCTDSTYGALLVVTGNPAPGQVSLADVQALNEQAGWGQHITVGDYVLHKAEVIPGDPQLTTIAQNLREAVIELDTKQGDEVLTVVDTLAGKTIAEEHISAAINVLDKEMGDVATSTVIDTVAGETAPKTNVVDAINVLDSDLGDVNTLTVKNAAGDLQKEAVAAINELDAKQGDAVITVIDTVGGEVVAKDNLSDAVNVLDAELGDINTLTVKNAAGTILKEVAAAINQLDLVQGDDVIVVKDSAGATLTTLTSSVNALDDRLPVNVAEVPEAELNPGIKAAYKLTQGITNPVELGLIEIPYSNYEGEATDTVTVIVDNSDDHRVISANVNDGSIGKQQLDVEVNGLLAYIGDKAIKLSDKDTLTEAINDNILALRTKMAYQETTSWLTFEATFKDNAAKNDVYVISTDFTVGGTSYNAGSWAMCTNVSEAGDRTWVYINNGGQGTVIKPITNETEISEVRDAEGKIIVTDVIGSANVGDPAGSIYLISTEGILKFAPHHGIYVKTADSGGTEVVEIFDFGKEGGADAYVGSEGANIKVTVDVVGTTGTIGASIVLGSLNKALMDTEINNIFNFTGYPTALTTTAQDLAGGVNEHDAELGDIINAALEIKDGTNNDVANILKAIAKNNLTWEDAITTTTATTTITATAPMKRGYVYNVTGVESTINGIACKPGDWLVVVSDTALGAQPSFLKLGSSSGGGMDDGGPFIKIN